MRWRFRHVLVDEAQDLNPIQYRLLELIVGSRRDLYLVGDPAQAIYGFNGSDPTLLSGIADRLPGVEVIRLPTNHRSTPQIVAAGAHVLRAGDASSTAVSPRPDGAAVRVVAADDEAHEASLVATFVRSLDPAPVRAGAVAVLARTNHQLIRLTEVLQTAGVPIRQGRLGPGTPLGAAVRTATALPSATRLREWAHDTLDDDTLDAERRVAAAVLEYLREHPVGDGAGLRWWIATTNPFDEEETLGVELLTFHGAKGREWPTVVVTGVETGLVPHRSATTIAGRIEEARLLHVALDPRHRPPRRHLVATARWLQPAAEPVDHRARRRPGANRPRADRAAQLRPPAGPGDRRAAGVARAGGALAPVCCRPSCARTASWWPSPPPRRCRPRRWPPSPASAC